MSAQMNVVRCFARRNPFMRRFSSEVQKTVKPTQQEQGTSEAPRDQVKVSPFRKRMFTMVGLFKSTADCPDTMSNSSMSRTMDKFRVRASMVLMVLAACGSLTSIFLAKGVVDDFEEEKRNK